MEKAALDGFMREEKLKPSTNNVSGGLLEKSLDFGALGVDDPFNTFSNNVAFYPSYDYSRNMMDRSS